MIAAWGESESDAKTENPEEEDYVSWTHTKARMKNPKESR